MLSCLYSPSLNAIVCRLLFMKWGDKNSVLHNSLVIPVLSINPCAQTNRENNRHTDCAEPPFLAQLVKIPFRML